MTIEIMANFNDLCVEYAIKNPPAGTAEPKPQKSASKRAAPSKVVKGMSKRNRSNAATEASNMATATADGVTIPEVGSNVVCSVRLNVDYIWPYAYTYTIHWGIRLHIDYK